MKVIFASLLSALIFSSCVTIQFKKKTNPESNELRALAAELKNDVLLVAYPTYKRREDILRKAISQYPESQTKLDKELNLLISDREADLQIISEAFRENFTFSKYLLIPDSLLRAYESGNEAVYFLNEKLELDPSLVYQDTDPFKIISRTNREWDLMKSDKILSTINYKASLRAILGIDSFDRAMVDIVVLLNEQLNKALP